jgi:hypothetical protein
MCALFLHARRARRARESSEDAFEALRGDGARRRALEDAQSAVTCAFLERVRASQSNIRASLAVATP